MKTYYDMIDSPIGTLTLLSSGTALTGVHMDNKRKGRGEWNAAPGDTARTFPDSGNPGWTRDPQNTVIREAHKQLTSYFAGELKQFDIALAAEGTPFQKCVWNELYKIPYGTTISYGELAGRVGNPNASRAVGLANGRNPIAIIVPCHRVIGANGKLVGFGGGLDRKVWLLELEQVSRALKFE